MGYFRGRLYSTGSNGQVRTSFTFEVAVPPRCRSLETETARIMHGREEPGCEYELPTRIDLSVSETLGPRVRDQCLVAQKKKRTRGPRAWESPAWMRIKMVNVEFPVLRNRASMNGGIEPLKCPRFTRGSAIMQIARPD